MDPKGTQTGPKKSPLGEKILCALKYPVNTSYTREHECVQLIKSPIIIIIVSIITIVIREGFRKKIRISYGLLPNRGAGGQRG